MPTNSPIVNWKVTNNNILKSVPLLGVSAVVAQTTMGPTADPSEVISSVRRFRELYGSEIVLDGSASNIEYALLHGSKIRVSRVNSGTSVNLTDEAYITAVEAFREYNDFYQVIFSHINQYFDGELGEPSKNTLIYSAARDLVIDKGDCSLFIGLPKYLDVDNETFGDYLDIISHKEGLSNSLGPSEFITYIAEGVYIPNSAGEVKYSDGMGAVLALADVSASEYGPWFSFAGSNRGIVNDGSNLGYPNYGLRGNYEAANALANNRICLFVKKPTRTTSRPVVMFWHNFTDTLQENSQRFLNVQRLIYYIKKNLTPILESYLEEPNTFSTWNSIYLEGRKVMDYLLNNRGITEYTWAGDQFVDKYEDLQINSEEDVRNGKYRIELSIKEVVSMQEINIELIIAPTGSSIEVVNP